MGQRKTGHVTLLDVARASGFSVSTVSIVLSEAPLSHFVAEGTRGRVKAVAQKLGYHPDAFARSLRRRRSQTIGVLPMISQIHFACQSFAAFNPDYSLSAIFLC